MKELTRFELAAIKRTAQNVKTMRVKKEKLEKQQEAITNDINRLEEMINDWEAPIVKMTGGFTSNQVLNGEMDIEQDSNLKTSDIEIDDSPLDEELMTENVLASMGPIGNEIN